MKIKSLLLAVLPVAAFIACQPVIQPATVSQVSVDPQILKVSVDGETKTVQLTANCDWETSCSAAWVKVAPASGTGSTSITIIVAANEGDPREATVTVTATGAATHADLLVSQAGVQKETPGPGPGPDDPTPGSETAISTLAQLQSFMNTAPTLAADEEWTIEADIDCGGAKISPIPSFSANLDGKNHKIYNYIVESSEATSGLFLIVSGTIKNVILGSKDGKNWDGTSTVGYASAEAKTGHTGGVCASLQGTLENVKNFAKVVVVMKNDDGVSGIGGLVGTMDSPSKVSGCDRNGNLPMMPMPTSNVFRSIMPHWDCRDVTKTVMFPCK